MCASSQQTNITVNSFTKNYLPKPSECAYCHTACQAVCMVSTGAKHRSDPKAGSSLLMRLTP